MLQRRRGALPAPQNRLTLCQSPRLCLLSASIVVVLPQRQRTACCANLYGLFEGPSQCRVIWEG